MWAVGWLAAHSATRTATRRGTLNQMAVLLAATILLLPTLSAAPHVCEACHPGQTARYLASPMGRSLTTPQRVAPGVSRHQRSGSTVKVELRDGKMFHKLSEKGLSAEYEIAYQIGAGKFAHTYITRINGYLFESPATWFRAAGWDSSPGYAPAPVIDFDRPITSTCLFCHASGTEFNSIQQRQKADASLSPISCERCHGPSEKHLQNPSKQNILQPAKLPPRARDSICEQCHLEGETRILSPGKSWADFHPGDNLDQTITSYVFQQNGHRVKPVNQVEQLAQSQCAVQSKGKLWCGSCHNPHGETAIEAVCTSCHATISKASHSPQKRECTSCHMPRVESEYVHVAVTNHAIVRRPAQSPAARESKKTLAVWVEPPEAFRLRNLALANLTVGLRMGMPALVDTGLSLAKSIAGNSDPEMQEAECRGLLLKGRAREAAERCRLAARKQPESADHAMHLGIALARSGDAGGAESELLRAIKLDPSLKHAYVQLWTLYDNQGNQRGMRDTMNRFLQWNPQNIMFRALKDSIGEKPDR